MPRARLVARKAQVKAKKTSATEDGSGTITSVLLAPSSSSPETAYKDLVVVFKSVLELVQVEVVEFDTPYIGLFFPSAVALAEDPSAAVPVQTCVVMSTPYWSLLRLAKSEPEYRPLPEVHVPSAFFWPAMP